jgi:SAM-dependent methyltransferase
MTNNKGVAHNIRVHDRLGRKYDATHGEIFNPIEQERVRDRLSRAGGWIRTTSRPQMALDFGCGSGNLTRHLIASGFDVVAADVSGTFLEMVRQRFGPTGKLAGVLPLNGLDLREVEGDRFDMAAAYSVLHHVPDYLLIVKELARVLRPGGVLYVDHEVNENFWTGSAEYREFLRRACRFPWRKYLTFSNYATRLRRLLDPRYSAEGDIHVWPEDRIEWDKIEAVLAARGFEILLREDYLLCRRDYRLDVYRQYQGRCSDMRLLVARRPTVDPQRSGPPAHGGTLQ